MDYLYCPNCGKMTGHKRALGMGTLLGSISTLGASTTAIPFYPKRCIVCGRKSSEKFTLSTSGFSETSQEEPQDGSGSSLQDTKKCPACAELIRLEAIKCRFCGERFDPADVARVVAEARGKDRLENRVLCIDGNCIGIIGSNGKCMVCGKSYRPD